MARYKNYNDGQHYFDIIDLENDLPADNRARIIREIISTIDVSSFDKNYNNDEGGAKAKHIRMMLGILLLAFVRYTTGSRSIVKYFGTDLEFKNKKLTSFSKYCYNIIRKYNKFTSKIIKIIKQFNIEWLYKSIFIFISHEF